MSSTPIETEDWVRLKSGGPEMVVLNIIRRDLDGKSIAACAWLNCRGERQELHYPIVCLSLAKKADEDWPLP